ncbi:MAG: hypothetical protein AAF828_09330, partial [Bacteroidota bacterium]
MRQLLSPLFLLLTLLACDSIFAMATLTTAVGTADIYCTDPADPNNCLPPPIGNDTLILNPDDPTAFADIVVAYRFENNTGFTITQTSLSDSEYGLIIPTSAITVAPGGSLVRTERFSPPTTPGTHEITATMILVESGGNSLIIEATYVIVVLAAEAEINVYPILAEDICTDTTDLATCGVAPTSTPTTLTVPPGEKIYLELRIQNLGAVTLSDNNWDDSQYGLLFDNNGTNITPGADIRFRQLLDAPTVPGTYHITMQYTGSDALGNETSLTTTYTLIVPSPQGEINVYPIRAEDICTDTTDLATCGVAPVTTPNTLDVAPGEKIYLEFRIQNTGDVTLTNNDWDDSQYGLLFDDNGTNINPGADIRFRQLLDAPTVPGTYNLTVTYTGTDDFGNALQLTTPYTLVVLEPQGEINAYPIRAEEICADTTDLATCGVAPVTTPNTLDVAPGEKIYLEFRIQNTGAVTLTNNDWDDSQYGLLFDDNGTNIRPGVDIRFRQLLDAPTTPGTYNIIVTYTGTDDFGNALQLTTSYTLVVLEPQVDIDVFPFRAEEICADTTDLATCGVAPVTTPNTLDVAPGEKIYLEFRIQNTGAVTLTNNDWDDSQYGLLFDDNGTNINPGADIRFRQLLDAPTTPGTYNITVTYTGTDDFGNSLTRTAIYILNVDCSSGDLAPPNVICQDQHFSIQESESITLSIADINNGSTDNCGGPLDGELSQTVFTCADEGDNTVTLTARDQNNNQASCTATVSITVTNNIATGIINECIMGTTDLSSVDPQAWVEVRTPNDRLIAEVQIGNNTNLSTVIAEVYRRQSRIINTNTFPVLSKQVALRFENAGGQTVQPNNNPVRVRLYYTAAEASALINAQPGSDASSFTLVKTDDACGEAYSGSNAQEMNTTLQTTGCGNNDYYLEYFTATFSSFFLFPNGAVLPVTFNEFTAQRRNDRAVKLYWTTAAEYNNRYFEVQRSSNGRSFQAIGETEGNGTVEGISAYDFIDPSPLAGSNYYRLKQIDFDGGYAYSEVRLVNMEASTELPKVFPNPVRDQLSLKSFTGGEVQIFDLSGRQLRQQWLGQGEALLVAEL